MIIVFFRTLILYISVMICMRVMGKRQLGELQPFELVVTIMISDLASVPMQNMGIPLLNGLVAILTLVVIEIIFSFIVLKNKRARDTLIGRPSILVYNGEVNMKELGELRFNIDDLMEELRKKDISNIDDVQFAILETDGGFSVIPKAGAKPVTVSNAGINEDEEEIPYEIILDGRVLNKNIKKCNLTYKQVKKMLKEQGYVDEKEIAVATYTNNKGLTVKGKK